MGYFLNAGDLLSSEGCSIGDYRIDWRLGSTDGHVVFRSGNAGNADEEIDSFHPLVNQIVVGGTLYPTIRYIYSNGYKYTPYVEEESRYSPDLLTCLSPVTVDEVSCDTVLNPDANYDFVLTREVGVGEKSRSIRFNIGASTNYVAWSFTALQVPDRLNIYYCKDGEFDGELIDAIILGGTGITTNYTPANYPRQTGYNPNIDATPIRISTSGEIPYVSTLSPFMYNEGDWIRFEIIGNVTNPSHDDTKWVLKIKCFESLDLSNNFLDVGKINLATLSIYDETANCRRVLSYQTIESIASVNNGINIFLRKYFYFRLLTTGLSPNSTGAATIFDEQIGATTITHLLPYSVGVSLQTFFSAFTSQCFTLSGTIVISANGTGDTTFAFSDSSDYNFVAANIAVIQSSSYYTDFLSSTDSDIEYYRFYYFQLRVSDGCDKSFAGYVKYIHFGSSVSYNSPNSITFSLSPLINNYPTPLDSCNTVKSSLNFAINAHNTEMGSSYNLSTVTRYGGDHGGICGIYVPIIVSNDATNRTVARSIRIEKIMANGILPLEDYGFCVDGTGFSKFYVYDRLYMEDIDNYLFERMMSLETNNCADTDWEIISEATTTTTIP